MGREGRHRVLLLSVLLGLGLLAAPAVEAQQPAPQTSPAPPANSGRPGRFRLGPFYFTPLFHIRSIGLDTNVFYTAEDRRTDIAGVGGPGFELVLPIKASSRFYVNGGLNYIYFVRTPSQRRLTGAAASGIALNGQRTHFILEEAYATTYERPGFEVDKRIEQVSEQTRAEVSRRLFWRISLRLGGSRGRYETDLGQEFLGSDLRSALSRDEYRAGGGLGYMITVKTSFVVEAEQQWSRFLEDPTRDATWRRAAVGFRTDPSALIAGEALVGVQYFRPELPAAPEAHTRYASVNTTWNFSPKTHLLLSYKRSFGYSAFTPSNTPLLLTEELAAGLEKRLLARVDLRLSARRTHLLSDGEVTVDIPDKGPETAVRDDVAWEYGADLGYYFRPRLRIGVAATYTDRKSTISYFGIQGLIFGGTVRYNP